MTFINLTPHSITLCGLVIPPSGTIARVAVTRVPYGVCTPYNNRDIQVPLFIAEYGEVSGLPAQAERTIYIVSALVRQAVPERYDVGSPADLVRDEKGNVVGANSLDVNKIV